MESLPDKPTYYSLHREERREYQRLHHAANKAKNIKVHSLEDEIKAARVALYRKERKKSAGKKYNEDNKEKIREYNKRYRADNAEKIREKQKESGREYYNANKDRIRENAKKYREDNKEKIKKHLEEYRIANKEKLSEANRKYYAENIESCTATRQAYRDTHTDIRRAKALEYRNSNKEILARIQKEYRTTERGKEATSNSRRAYRSTDRGKEVRRACAHRREARKMALPGFDYTTAEMIKARCEMWGNRCYICGDKMQAIDHVKPISKGGAHLPCNLRPICKRCNSIKADKWPYLGGVNDTNHAGFLRCS
jgi:5-methylcytosine-specific restriction endonuclease McrA